MNYLQLGLLRYSLSLCFHIAIFQGSSPDNLRSVSCDDFEGVTELITEYKENIVAIGEAS